MKNKSTFFQIIFLIVMAFILTLLTISVAFIAGSIDVEIFDFKNLNWSNMIPFVIIGFATSGLIVVIFILFILRSVFNKTKDYFDNSDINNKNGGNKK